MAQLENDDNLAVLDPSARHLIVVVMETGLRANDACQLPFNPLLEDRAGWPCLRSHSRKVNNDQVVPLPGRAPVAIRDQQAVVSAALPTSPWLFPGPTSTTGSRPFTYDKLNRRLSSWQKRIGLGSASTTRTAAPFMSPRTSCRHTVGTRLINAGVPNTSSSVSSAMPARA
ncbi:MAG TPA: tyrosine-type recombinase/integrase [Acidimicrobiales bacterium]|nr:tyrosine-type recombinase/integrase [Acidimicrobiales bacterium]